jgi:hypothetical protein
MTDHDDDLQPVADRLRAARPQLTALELDDISRRVRARGAAARRRPRSAIMKSRVTILAMLVAGILLSTTGAGLAVSGISSGNDASTAQYGPATPPQGDVLGEEESGGGGGSPSTPAPAAAQPARQVESGDNSLPFTGFAALPILIGGVALLGGGMVLRHRTRSDS